MNRLLCILSNMNMGGAETFLMKIYRVIDRTEYQMDFCISVKEKCDYEDEIIKLGGRVYRVPSKTENSKKFKKMLSEIVSENGYINVLRITSNAAGFWDLKISKKSGAKLTVARSSNASDGSMTQSFINLIGRLLWGGYVDKKIAPSSLAAEYTFGKKAAHNGDVALLRNGLDLYKYRFDESARNNIRKELGLLPETAVIGHIGRFNRQKNHKFLISVFSELLKKRSDAVLILTGVGDNEPEIRNEVDRLGLNNNVIFTGLRKDIPALLSAFDVFILPSLYEGMPNVVIEAQACGVPCILSDTVTREADLSGKTVYLPLSEPDRWAAKAEVFLQGGRIAANMEDYDIHLVAGQFCRCCYLKGAGDI